MYKYTLPSPNSSNNKDPCRPWSSATYHFLFVLSCTEKCVKLILLLFIFLPASLTDFGWHFPISLLKWLLWRSWMTSILLNPVVVCCPDLSQPFSGFGHSCPLLPSWLTLFSWVTWHHTLGYFSTPLAFTLSFFFCLHFILFHSFLSFSSLDCPTVVIASLFFFVSVLRWPHQISWL